jgi:uridylate kinase
MPGYKRILLKLSGESLAGKGNHGIDTSKLHEYADQVVALAKKGVQVAIVIGGGNIFRGLSGVSKGFDRVKGDQMGMLATVINSLALEAGIVSAGGKARVFTAVRMEPVGEIYKTDNVITSLRNGEVAILAGGTGNPFFTTDTASALRAVEIKADVLFKGTRVDGVYDSDPEKNPRAKKFNTITFDEAYRLGLKIMDLTAFTLCKENNMPILVFNMDKPGTLIKAATKSKGTGTIVKLK